MKQTVSAACPVSPEWGHAVQASLSDLWPAALPHMLWEVAVLNATPIKSYPGCCECGAGCKAEDAVTGHLAGRERTGGWRRRVAPRYSIWGIPNRPGGRGRLFFFSDQRNES